MISKLKLLSKTQIQNAVFNRFYYTNRVNKATLYSIISPLGNPSTRIEPELEKWVNSGNKVRVGELQRIIRDLRQRKRFSQALEVSDWMNRKGICVFAPSDHAVQLDLIGRVHGYLSAESYFNNLKDDEKTYQTYGALLNCYVRQRQTDEALSHFQKMKEMGFAQSSLNYNDILCLYSKTGEYEKVLDVLNEMKEKKVSPDNFSYRLCIHSYGARSDIEGMENTLREMESQPHIVMDWSTYASAAHFYIKANLIDKALDVLKKAEERLEQKNGLGYNYLISLYAGLGNRSEVLRLWDLEKTACKRYINRDYITMLEALMKLGEHEEAEKVLKEWESSGNSYDTRVPNAVVIGYCNDGLIEKAEAILEDLAEKGKATTPNSWAVVAAGYVKAGKTQQGLECMKAALSVYVEGKGWKPNPNMITSILSKLGEEATDQDVEAFVAALKSVIQMNRQMYHALIKAKIKNGKEVVEILDRMKADGIDEDEETKEILGMRQN